MSDTKMSDHDEYEEDLGPADEGETALVTDKGARQWAMWIHLSNLANYILWPLSIALPIILWQIKKDELPAIDAHGKAATNWTISFSIYMIVGVLLSFVLIGIPILIAVGIAGIVFPVIGGLKANEGKLWKYPFTIQFLK